MTFRFEKEIDRLKKQILNLGAVVEERLHLAVQALQMQDQVCAKRVIDGDFEIDQLEVDLEEECLKLLALYQPVAIDLRFIIAVLKINNDLERIGDLAVNISERSMYYCSQSENEMPVDFEPMSTYVKRMLKNSLDSLVNKDTSLAFQVLEEDDFVDRAHVKNIEFISKKMKEDPERIDCLQNLLSASRHLERIADQATNIAEDVIYMIEGNIIRHRAEIYRHRADKEDKT